ncbi:hypothetical protein, partial [Bacteroides heparinolyticus]
MEKELIEEKALQIYEENCSQTIERITSSLSSSTTQSLCNTAAQVADAFIQLKREQQLLDAQLLVIKEVLKNNMEKFQEIIRKAEVRLDRHLDTIDKWTELLLARDLASLDEKELNAHQTIMNLIQMANDRFNQELE